MTTVEANAAPAPADADHEVTDVPATGTEPVVEVLVEEISIDGMCGVY